MENSSYDLSLANCLRFHGSNLTRLLSSKFSKLDDENAEILSRARILLNTSNKFSNERKSGYLLAEELKINDERQFIVRLQEFMAEKFSSLFGNEVSKRVDAESKISKSEGNLEIYAVTPTFENYLDISGKKLKERFFEDIRPGDFICGEIRVVEEIGITIRLVCVDSERFQRDLEDLRLDVFIARHELVVSKPGEDPFSIYCKHKLIRALVSGVNAEKYALTLSLKSGSTIGAGSTRRLGIISESELPAYFRVHKETEDSNGKYDDELRKSSGIHNPYNVDVLCRHFDIQCRGIASFSSEVINRYNSFEESFQELRKIQSTRLAMKSVVKGIERLRNKQNTEAMQHFSKALDIDPDNVEGLVGRGALYANCESFEPAIKDFEHALRIDPNHSNGRLYFMETLMAQAKAFEKKRHRQEARECYERILQMEPNNEDAKRRLNKLISEKKSEKRKLDSDSESVVEIPASMEPSVKSSEKVKVSRSNLSYSKYSNNSSSYRSQHTSRNSHGNSHRSEERTHRNRQSIGQREKEHKKIETLHEDRNLQRQLSDMEKFIAGLKSKQGTNDKLL